MQLGRPSVGPWAAEAKCTRPDGIEPGGRRRTPAAKQRHLMPQAHQFVDQPRHDTFGPAVEPRGNTLGQRCHLGNSHQISVIEAVKWVSLLLERWLKAL